MIDLEDLPLIDKAIKTSWYSSKDEFYVSGGKPNIIMHRLIMNTPKGKVVDHINHNRLDNRRSNLRNCTQSENARNRTNTEELIRIGMKKEPVSMLYAMPKTEPIKYLTTEDLASEHKVSKYTIGVWRKKGLPTLKIGRTVRFNPDDVFKWIEENNEE